MREQVTLEIDGKAMKVVSGCTVAAAIAMACGDATPLTRCSVGGEARGPLCGMGVCQECRVTIDGVRHRLACQTLCATGMSVLTAGAAP
ncbi:2Fe-2S iron-sulfur cluster-binding protein [Cupriavidus necator]|uniref:2Fe-2S iron-sulfur cluster-binding protein n=1 Tax=Cupriavidus necator TaxID=106590 RepID=UPI0039C1FE15